MRCRRPTSVRRELEQAKAILLRQLPLDEASEDEVAGSLASDSASGASRSTSAIAPRKSTPSLTAAQVRAAFAKIHSAGVLRASRSRPAAELISGAPFVAVTRGDVVESVHALAACAADTPGAVDAGVRRHRCAGVLALGCQAVHRSGDRRVGRSGGFATGCARTRGHCRVAQRRTVSRRCRTRYSGEELGSGRRICSAERTRRRTNRRRRRWRPRAKPRARYITTAPANTPASWRCACISASTRRRIWSRRIRRSSAFSRCARGCSMNRSKHCRSASTAAAFRYSRLRYATRLSASPGSRRSKSSHDADAEALQTVREAIVAEPAYVGGTARFDSALHR